MLGTHLLNVTLSPLMKSGNCPATCSIYAMLKNLLKEREEGMHHVKKEKLKRLKDSANQEEVDRGKPPTRSAFSSAASAELCFFCERPATKYGPPLSQVQTKELDETVRLAAIKMEDSKLLAKLAAGDMIAIEAM
jgi:hypothetical protein